MCACEEISKQWDNTCTNGTLYHLSDDPPSINLVPEAVKCVLPVDIVGKVVHLDWILFKVRLSIALQPVHHQLNVYNNVALHMYI